MDSLCNMSEFTKATMLAKANGEMPYKAVINDLTRRAEKIESKRLENIRVAEMSAEKETIEDEGR